MFSEKYSGTGKGSVANTGLNLTIAINYGSGTAFGGTKHTVYDIKDGESPEEEMNEKNLFRHIWIQGNFQTPHFHKDLG